jgi:enamine deaminase RidA (YjgF/YER057c/UK114 family)
VATERQLISSGAPWEPVVGYSRAVRVGPFVFVGGTAPADAEGRVIAPGDPYGQAVACFRIIEAALAEAGASLSDVVRTRVFVTDIAHWPEIGRAHAEAVGRVRPACTMVQVSRLIDPAMLVEIEADAVIAAELAP